MRTKKRTSTKKQISKQMKNSKEKQISKEIKILVGQGAKLYDMKKVKTELNIQYESWYTKSLAVVQQLIPERLDDFINAYKCDKRKALDATTYRIYDFLQGIVQKDGYGEESFNSKGCFDMLLVRQISILHAALENVDSILHDIKGVLKAEMYDSELEAAKELRKNNHIRAAGVLCGVLLEGYFNSVAQRRKIKITKRNPTISDYNDALKNAGVYDVPKWRLIQRLGDIRNYCGHKKEREPTNAEVDDLIIGTEKVIKEVF